MLTGYHLRLSLGLRTQATIPVMPHSPISRRQALSTLLIAGTAGALASRLLGAASPGQAPSTNRRVLFWGGQGGLHRPKEQFERISPTLLSAGYSVDYAGEDDNQKINDENLARYDAILVYNQSSAPKITISQVDSLYRFAEAGKGIVFCHMSIVAGSESDRYYRLVGGVFLGHGNGEFVPVGSPDSTTLPNGTEARENIRLDYMDTSHPALKGVERFSAWDETFTLKSDPGITVLQHRPKMDDPASNWTWVREQGKGRIYYCAYGHDQNTWGHAAYQKQLATALNWVTKQT